MTIATRKDDAAETIVETAETTENAALGTDTNDEGVMTAEDLAALCESRSETYSFLARLFREEVDEALLAQLNDTDYPVSSGNGLMDEGYYQIAKYLSNAWVDPLMKLSVDYTRAFLGSGIDTYSAAYPFESVYTSEKRLLVSDARDEVLAIYRSCGLEKSESWPGRRGSRGRGAGVRGRWAAPGGEGPARRRRERPRLLSLHQHPAQLHGRPPRQLGARCRAIPVGSPTRPFTRALPM